MEEGKAHAFTIETVTLDSLLTRESVPPVDVIKMDVEGAQELILRGATNLSSSLRPKVIFEINPGACDRLELSRRAAWDFLASRGYVFFLTDAEGQLNPVSDPPEAANVIALHPAAHPLPKTSHPI